MILLKQPILAFIIGSSIIATFITQTHIFVGWFNNRPNNFPIQFIPFIIPIMFGIFNTIVNMFQYNSTTQYTVWMFIFGFIFGIILSVLGTFVLNAPEKIFNKTKKNKKDFLIITPILYSIIWGVLINIMNQYFNVANIGN
jgi:putative flippase GtrA